MPELDKQKVFAGRLAVDDYREAHRLLHQKPYYYGIHDDHTPLLNKMKTVLSEQGFGSIQAFFDASKTLGDEWR